jgi:hypothetical protein
MDTVGFVPEPSYGRGTVSIIWSCLATIFFVVWTVQHIEHKENMSKWMWSLCIFFMPEAMAASAVRQLLAARRLQGRLRGIRGWESWSLEQSFIVLKNGLTNKGSGGFLTADELVHLAEKDHRQCCGGLHIGMLPERDDVNRRSKKGWLEKVIAGGQAVWFCANMASRVVGGFQVTLLEDITAAYACCGLIAMAAWLRCPQDVGDAFEVDLCGIEASKGTGGSEMGDLQALFNRCISGLAALSLTVVTAVHLAVWEYPFASAAEAWIWRCCAVATLPLGFLIVYFRGRNMLLLSCTGFIVARLGLWTVACTAFRRMPVSAFDMPNWCEYWGHIGK